MCLLIVLAATMLALLCLLLLCSLPWFYIVFPSGCVRPYRKGTDWFPLCGKNKTKQNRKKTSKQSKKQQKDLKTCYKVSLFYFRPHTCRWVSEVFVTRKLQVLFQRQRRPSDIILTQKSSLTLLELQQQQQQQTLCTSVFTGLNASPRNGYADL